MSGIIPLSPPPDALANDADLCVKCGLCLPHCPTYGVTRDEAESPRGRIALMHGFATGALDATPALEAHLDGCLACRACEAVCPAHVPYGRLLDATRARLAERRPQRAQRLLAAVMTRAPLRFAVALLLWLYQRSGVQAIVRSAGWLGRGSLARLDALLPRVYLPRRPRTAADGGGTPVALFVGCTSPLAEPATLAATVTLLERLGCAVTVPPAQGCCGALHRHAGLAAGADACTARNREAFRDANPIVGVASGCTAELRSDSGGLASRVQDAAGFVARHPGLERLRFRPLAARAVVHTPCTLRNVLRDEGAVSALLARIPGLIVEALPAGCCGAAGSYLLDQPAMADRLLQPLVQRLAAHPPDYVLSGNVGCALHLAAGLRRAGLTVPVWHPLRLLAQQSDGPSGSPRGAAAAAPPARPA